MVTSAARSGDADGSADRAHAQRRAHGHPDIREIRRLRRVPLCPRPSLLWQRSRRSSPDAPTQEPTASPVPTPSPTALRSPVAPTAQPTEVARRRFEPPVRAPSPSAEPSAAGAVTAAAPSRRRHRRPARRRRQRATPTPTATPSPRPRRRPLPPPTAHSDAQRVGYPIAITRRIGHAQAPADASADAGAHGSADRHASAVRGGGAHDIALGQEARRARRPAEGISPGTKKER